MYNRPRGTADLFGNEMRVFEKTRTALLENAYRFGFSQVKTPMFEETELFIRNVGTDTDVVNKEMYTFLDKSDRSMTLRPELTASAIRLYSNNKLFGHRLPIQKLCYFGEAFRYERPGNGRFRQFHQFGVEMIGSQEVESDLEIITLVKQITEQFGISKQVKLYLNTIGQSESRKNYNFALRGYFQKHEEEMCHDCKRRIETNTLRILDCKIDGQTEIVKNAPKLHDYLTDAELSRFQQVLAGLSELGIDYEISQKLVRGLDYYNDTVFEFVYVTDKEELTICGGGRYDKMVESFGIETKPAIGFGLGIERLISLAFTSEDIAAENQEIDIFYIPLCDEAKSIALKSMTKLRAEGIACEADFSERSIKSKLKQAEYLQAIYAVVIGQKEVEAGEVTIKELATFKETAVKLDDFENDVLEEGKWWEHQLERNI
ncbi:MAG: histidine--tRNA ligase [Mycoplasmatales bacterium]